MVPEETSQWVAEAVGGVLRGPGDVPVRGVASLADALPDQVSFLGHPKYRSRVLPSAAGVVLVPPGFDTAPPSGRAWVVCDRPSDSFSILVQHFAPPPAVPAPGIHATAVVAASACLGAGVHLGPHVVLGAGARVGDRSVIEAGCCIGEGSRIGEDCRLYPNVTVRERCCIGNRVIIHPGAVIGADGFGYVSGPRGHAKIPQLGSVQIDDDVEIGALTAVDRARFGRTWIQRGTKIDNLVQIAHNVVVGQGCLVAGQAGLSGSCRLGNGVILAGQVGLIDHCAIGDGAIVMGQSGVTADLDAGALVFGTPALDRREFARMQMNVKRLERLQRTIRELESRLAALERRGPDPP
ncbi:MAG: UDP-3-O-(3-hydroxymyristoyl)glucosamine N-acyltransferase [Lentisphaeria bacterium]|nr:UDP-3-O-(3-hydroxymyristoyl)glucosamine N-acyltransferase [Lentisphaeria bacterium]